MPHIIASRSFRLCLVVLYVELASADTFIMKHYALGIMYREKLVDTCQMPNGLHYSMMQTLSLFLAQDVFMVVVNKKDDRLNTDNYDSQSAPRLLSGLQPPFVPLASSPPRVGLTDSDSVMSVVERCQLLR